MALDVVVMKNIKMIHCKRVTNELVLLQINSSLDATESSPSNNLTTDTNGDVPSTTPSDSGPLKNGLADDHRHPPSPLNEAPLNGASDSPEESQSSAPVPCASVDRTFNSCGTNTTFDLQAYEEIATGFRSC